MTSDSLLSARFQTKPSSPPLLSSRSSVSLKAKEKKNPRFSPSPRKKKAKKSTTRDPTHEPVTKHYRGVILPPHPTPQSKKEQCAVTPQRRTTAATSFRPGHRQILGARRIYIPQPGITRRRSPRMHSAQRAICVIRRKNTTKSWSGWRGSMMRRLGNLGALSARRSCETPLNIYRMKGGKARLGVAIYLHFFTFRSCSSRQL